MRNSTQCRALKRDGVRCENTARFAGFCGVHLPQKSKKAQSPSIQKPAWKVVEIAATLAGAVELIKLIVDTWKSLPFGPGPQMPEEYDYLAKRLGSLWSRPSRVHRASNRSADSVDWRKAKKIYDTAMYTIARLDSGEQDVDALVLECEKIDADLNDLWDTMQESLRQTICESLGESQENKDVSEA